MDNNTFDFSTPGKEVGEDFEDRVFAKIKKKKVQRKVTVSVTLTLAVIAVVFTGTFLLFHQPPRPDLLAQPETIIKEEIPLTEDVVFATSDNRTSYIIEQVAYTEENTSL